MTKAFAGRLIVLCCLALSVAGCTTVKGWFSVDEDDGKEPAPLVDISQEVRVKRVWGTSVGDGQGDGFNHLHPVINGDVLYAASNDGLVVALDKHNGKRIWKQDMDVPFSGGVGFGEGQVLLGTSDGAVYALNAGDGSVLWTTSVQGEVLAAPQGDGQIVVVQSYDGKLQGLDANDGSQLWVYDSNLPILTLRGTSTPLIFERIVIAGFANGKVLGFDLKTGAIRWEARVAIAQGRSEIDRIVDIDGSLLLVGSVVYAASYQGRVVGVDVTSGRKVWQEEASSYVGPDQGFGNIYLATIDGSVVAYQRSGEGVRWQQSALENRRLSAPRAVRGYVAVGDLDGYIHFMSQVDGHFVGRTQVDSSGVRGNMLVDNNILYVLGNSGKLVALQVTAKES